MGHDYAVQLSESASLDDVDRTTKDGKVEHWTSELLTNPSALVRAGWTKSRSIEALKPGTRVKLYIGTSRAGGLDGIVMKIENEKGENIVGERGNAQASIWTACPAACSRLPKRPCPARPATTNNQKDNRYGEQ